MATVLVVDDVALNRDLVSMLLSYRGHDVVSAQDGAEALALAESRHPDVVVTDVLMPGIDGLELVHRLRSGPDPRSAQAPVIFYTANYLEPETRPIAEACGVSRVVVRGGDPRELLDAVDDALREGPVAIDVEPTADFDREHARAVNANLVEKVRALRHSERRFEVMASSSPVGIALIDERGNADYVNPRLREITGRSAEELSGRGWQVCLDETAELKFDDALQEHRYRTHITRPDETKRWLRVLLRPVSDPETGLSGAVLMADDVTDMVESEERVVAETMRRQKDARQRDAERLDSLRRMAGGMAHDFNNLLGTVLGFLALAVESIGEEADGGRLARPTATMLLEDLGQANRSAERAAKLTDQLLAFGRREINQPEDVDLSEYLTQAVPALSAAAGASVRLEVHPAPSVPLIRIDPRGLDRLLHSLVRNAHDAMPRGGTVTVSTSAPSSGEAVLTVTDTGRGMPPEVMARAFEPFFSTKTSSRTAGLGLSTSHGIVTQAGGEILLESTPGEGTTVTVHFPASGSPAPKPAEKPAEEPKVAKAPENSTILLVDDEDALRNVTARFISTAGYQVLTAASGTEAMEIVETHKGPIDCLVTDVVMPGMDGRQLAHRFREARPGAQVLFISGFAESLIDEQGRSLEPGSTIVPKPFSGKQLSDAIKATLS